LNPASEPTEHSPATQNRSAGSLQRFIVLIAIGAVLSSVVWELREPPALRLKTDEAAIGALTAEKIPLVTGDESIVEVLTKPGCPVCHIIPGIPGAAGKVGPPLILGTTGPQRLKDPRYRGEAKTVHEYIVESVLEPQRFVLRGYPEHTMPSWYGSKLSGLALEKMASYLERQTGESSTP
jgi:hypothetical protein